MIGLEGVRICMATSSHPADDDRIFFKEARSLVKAGAYVVVICAHNQILPVKQDGVHFVNYSGGGSLKDRAFTISKLEKAITEQHCDVIHCHEPDSLIAALRVKRRLGVKVIFDSHEMWSGVTAARFPKVSWPLVEAIYQRIERKMVSRCDAALGASLFISEYFGSILGAERVSTILNVPVVEIFGDYEERVWGEETILCHDGHLTFDRGLKTMLKALRILSEHHQVVLKIVGDVFGDEKSWLEAFVSEYHLEKNIVKSGWLPYQDVGKSLAPCNIGLICFLPLPNNKIAAPNKCFNYLLYGMPIVGPNFSNSHFAILEKEGCACLADPDSPEAYAEVISKMILQKEKTAKMALASRELSNFKYRWEHMEPVLIDLYKRVLGKDFLPKP